MKATLRTLCGCERTANVFDGTIAYTVQFALKNGEIGHRTFQRDSENHELLVEVDPELQP